VYTLLFLILCGLTGAMPFFCCHLPAATPRQCLRAGRYAANAVASFFAVAALGHVWWMLFYFYSRDIHSAAYIVVVLIDCTSLLTTITGTLLAMLQDRRHPMYVTSCPSS
jgi:hypothetical protein